MSAPVADTQPIPPGPPAQVKRPRLAKMLRVLAIPIILIWLAIAVLTNVLVPSLDDITAANAGPLVARDAPSAQAAIHMGNDFNESDFTSVAVLLLETHGRKLDEGDHQYYNEVVRRLLADTKHVQSVQDLWGKPVTMSGSQSADAQATTLNIRPTGDLGSSKANESIESIRDVIAKVPKPQGLSTYVTGPAPLAADTLHATDASLVKLTIVTVILILILLLITYRSITRAIIPLMGVLTTLAAARGIIAFLVQQGVIEISSFASNLLVSLVLGASTDYAIFYIGRYQEARQDGEDKESSYYISVANVPHIILGSGTAITGATLCLSLTHLDYFRTLGPPCAVSMVVAVLSALTLGPALLTVGSKIGWLQPRKKRANPVWRKVGTMIARWPVPMIAVAALIIPLCMLGWTTYNVSYNDRDFAPASVEASTGYAAADKHFPTSWLNNDIVYLKSDHDMRNTADMISMDRVAKAIIRTPGVAMVQSVTRPNGRPIEHASLPFAFGSLGTKLGENLGFLRDRIKDIGTLADTTGNILQSTQRIQDITKQLVVGTHLSRQSAEQLRALSEETRDHLADFDDFFRPMRNYFYWEPHCYDIPICFALRSLYDSIDTVDSITDELGNTVKGISIIDTVTPQIIPQIQSTMTNLRAIQSLTLTLQSTLNALVDQLDVFINPLVDMAQSFDNAKNDDFFFLPPDALKTADFKVGMDFFMTPDGKGARLVFYHDGEAQTPAGIEQVRNVTASAQQALKGTSLSNAKIYLAGAASNYRDVQDYSFNDIIIMMLATFALVFCIVLAITRALVGSILVLITVMLSFAGAYGLSVFIWETLLHTQLHWLTLPIAFIVLVAVGCDYNLLMLSRYREELGAGIKTGLIRTMGSSGGVVFTAAFVFAFTMLALLASDVVNIGQAGTTICIGLIFDMVVVRLFLVMPLARLLGPWFWWPQRISRQPSIRPEPEPVTGPIPASTS
ncbi:RND family transporter [Mycolicibacterium mucogenicum]|uniref:MMPL/RND family transporter n=1 Tax=Mycolicibacterium mucogenicum TaxID=56689 RepID=UPI00226AE392|nr:RND family transporter [Mycolicibacterium mucogenicum]MCX8564589.1 RND family transporter [Mycolicibacterium mucogenicum]